LSRYFQHVVMQTRCPQCHRGAGHWCRNEQGKAIPPHRARRQAALKNTLAAFAPLKKVA